MFIKLVTVTIVKWSNFKGSLFQFILEWQRIKYETLCCSSAWCSWMFKLSTWLFTSSKLGHKHPVCTIFFGMSLLSSEEVLNHVAAWLLKYCLVSGEDFRIQVHVSNKPIGLFHYPFIKLKLFWIYIYASSTKTLTMLALSCNFPLTSSSGN